MHSGQPMRSALIAIAFAAALAGAACTRSSTAPTPPKAVDLSGTWVGHASDSSGPGDMTWRLNQSAESVTGTLTLRDTDTGLNGQGTITGTVTGSSFTFSIVIAAGGFDAPFGTCTGTASGTATVSSAAIAGSYVGLNSCSGLLSSGQVTLSRS